MYGQKLITVLSALMLCSAFAAAFAQPGELRSPGKPGAAVQLDATPKFIPVGQTRTLNVLITSQAQADTLDVQVLPSPGLQVLSHGHVPALPMRAGEQVALPITVVAAEDGDWVLKLLVQTMNDGQARFRAMGIPVRAGQGGVVLKPADQLQKAADGRSIVSLPAQETIR